MIAKTIDPDTVTLEVLVQGYPGKTVCHGSLGWSTIALVRTPTRNVLIDVGSFGMRRILIERLALQGLEPQDITDVVLTHSHFDHSINWVTFPDARIVIGGQELDWSLTQPIGRTMVPELYVRELASHPRLVRIHPGEDVFPNFRAYATPGHTPGHLTYVLMSGEKDILFTGDAAKNRAELLCKRAEMTLDAAESTRSMHAIWELWQQKPGSVLVPGHDLPMVLREGVPHYVEEREGGVQALFGETIDQVKTFDLTF